MTSLKSIRASSSTAMSTLSPTGVNWPTDRPKTPTETLFLMPVKLTATAYYLEAVARHPTADIVR